MANTSRPSQSSAKTDPTQTRGGKTAAGGGAPSGARQNVRRGAEPATPAPARNSGAGGGEKERNQGSQSAPPAGLHTGTQSASQVRGDQQRDVPIGREQPRSGGVQPRGATDALSSESAQRSQSNNNPFTFLRRFSEDMDRLFGDFGFAPLSADPAVLLLPEIGLGGRSVGTGAQRSPGTSERSGASLSRPTSGSSLATRGAWFPQVEVIQRKGNLVVRADLPGIKREDIHVDIDDGLLTLSGSREHATEDEGDGFYHSERSYGSFSRTIPLPKDVTAEACEARFDNGVLEITVPLPKVRTQSRRLEIR